VTPQVLRRFVQDNESAAKEKETVGKVRAADSAFFRCKTAQRIRSSSPEMSAKPMSMTAIIGRKTAAASKLGWNALSLVSVGSLARLLLYSAFFVPHDSEKSRRARRDSLYGLIAEIA
jgi:hypothetical protein